MAHKELSAERRLDFQRERERERERERDREKNWLLAVGSCVGPY
jgi:hypothetical protein